MNPKTRNLIIGGILLGIFVLVVALAYAGIAAPDATSQPQDPVGVTSQTSSNDGAPSGRTSAANNTTPGTTSQTQAPTAITTQASPNEGLGADTGTAGMAVPTATNTLFPVYSIEPPTPAVTDLPFSAAEITVTLQISPEVIRDGDNFTVTLIATNTGQLGAYQTHCGLMHNIGNIGGAAQSKDDPVFTIVSEDSPIMHGYNDLQPGETQNCVFVLRAERPETLFLQGEYVGKVNFGASEWYKGGLSTWHKIQISPAVP